VTVICLLIGASIRNHYKEFVLGDSHTNVAPQENRNKAKTTLPELRESAFDEASRAWPHRSPSIRTQGTLVTVPLKALE